MINIVIQTSNGKKTFSSQRQIDDFLGCPDYEYCAITETLYERIKAKKGSDLFAFDDDDKPMTYQEWLAVIEGLKSEDYIIEKE